MLRAGFRQPDRFPHHVARLTGGEIRSVEGERILLRKLRILPLVERVKGPNPLVAVQHRRQIRLVTGRAKFSFVVDVLHHGLGVAIEMGEDLRIGHQAGNTVSLFIDHNGRHSHHETAIAQLGPDALDRVAGHAGEAIAVERAIHG